MSTVTPPEIGRFSGRTILTGAGWTRNWGGRLAAEIWEDLIGHPAAQNNAPLRGLLLKERSFEAALGEVQGEGFTAAERQAFEKALLDAFVAMDREIARTDHHPWINIHKVQDLLFRFWGQRGDSVNAGYIFTLNQDLWPERKLYNEHVSGAAAPALPGLQRKPDQRPFTTDIGRYSDRFIMEPVSDPASQAQLRGQFNVIKLHGSFNWRTADGRNALVVGIGKSGQIAASPLLSWYQDIFRHVLTVGGARLMVVGYGFGDEHINSVIADAVENHGLKIFIWDCGSNLVDRVRASPHGAAIWNGTLSTATRPLIEVFPSNQAETEEYRRIFKTMFG
jgi:hypothetical protein